MARQRKAQRSARAVLSDNLVLTTIDPCRAVNTRVAGPGGTQDPLATGETRGFFIVGNVDMTNQGGPAAGCAVPDFDAFGAASTQAIAANYVAVNAIGPGNLKAWPSGVTEPGTSVINYTKLAVTFNIANGTETSVGQTPFDGNNPDNCLDLSGNPVSGAGGDLCIKASTQTNVIVDITGYFASPFGQTFTGSPTFAGFDVENPAGFAGIFTAGSDAGVFATGGTGGNFFPFGFGVFAVDNDAAGTGVLGEATGFQGFGLWGIADDVTGFAAFLDGGSGTGVYAQSFDTNPAGWLFQGGSVESLRVDHLADDATGAGGADLILAEVAFPDANDPTTLLVDAKFRVAADGEVTADGSFTGGGADFAELLPANAGLEPGDVLAIGADGKLMLSSQANQSSVAGIYSTKPGFLGGAHETSREGKVPLAVVGIVPVKVVGENGAIQPGDLLVASSTPGHAMKASAGSHNGTVIGKALSPLEGEKGTIQMLVTLQ